MSKGKYMQETINKFIKGTQYQNIQKEVTKEDFYKGSIKEHTPGTLNFVKFVPASGAATRMFKDFYLYMETLEDNDSTQYFFENIKEFPFYDELNKEVIKNKKIAEKIWNDVFGSKEWAKGCFGTWMHRSAWSNEPVHLRMPGDTKVYDYSWNIDHIKPKSNYKNEEDSCFYNNYEPMHRLNNQIKPDNYPEFTKGHLKIYNI